MDQSLVKDIESLTKKAITIVVDGKEYSSYQFQRIIEPNNIKTLELTTLSGLCSYVKKDIDDLTEKGSPFFIAIKSYDEVHVYHAMEERCLGRTFVARATLSEDYASFPFDSFIDSEEFIIKVKSLFIQSEDTEKLLNYVSKMTAGHSVETGDDGVSQSTVVKKGVSGALKEREVAPSIITLKPYRTFREIEQPSSSFVFRLRQYDPNDMPKCALFEADGGAWKIKAMKSIKSYMEKELEGTTIIC